MSVKVKIEFATETQANKFMLLIEDGKFEEWFNEQKPETTWYPQIVDYEAREVTIAT